MTNFHRRPLSSSSISLAAGEARSIPRPRIEESSHEAPSPNPAAAVLWSLSSHGHLRAPSPARESDRGGSSDDESLLPPPFDDDDDEFQQVVNDTFEEAEQAGQTERELGGEWHNMMSAAMNAVDVMGYNPNVPVDPEYRCNLTLDWVYEPADWNGRLYSGAALRVYLNEKRSSSSVLRSGLVEDPFTRELVSSSMEPTPRPDLVTGIALAYSRALEQYNCVAGTTTLVADPGRGRGDPDRRTAIGTNFSNSLEGMHALHEMLVQAKRDGWQNSLGHGKRKKWIRDSIDGWFDRSLQGILST
jgi:hypothetical protein